MGYSAAYFVPSLRLQQLCSLYADSDVEEHCSVQSRRAIETTILEAMQERKMGNMPHHVIAVWKPSLSQYSKSTAAHYPELDN